jgi:hypothetical protein
MMGMPIAVQFLHLASLLVQEDPVRALVIGVNREVQKEGDHGVLIVGTCNEPLKILFGDHSRL